MDTKKEIEELKSYNWKLEWRLNHARMQFTHLLESVLPLLEDNERKNILRNLGRLCARSLGWAEKHKNNPEGFFAFMKNHNGEQISFSENKKTITVITKKRPCDCPLIKGKKISGLFCDCSIGWQMETYETILNKPVEVKIKEAVLRGDNKCVFEICIITDD